MFFYLLKNSTIIEQELDEIARNTKILIYGTVAYIVLHATLFIGGEDALLNCLKPYFWLFVILDISINTINSEIDFNSLLKRNNTNQILSSTREKPSVTQQINNVFDSFLKTSEIDGNERLNKKRGIIKNTNTNKEQDIKMGNPHIKRKSIQKKVHFVEDGYSSSDSDIGTDIDIESFKESLNSL
jgi:hypothetical protein